MLMGICRLYKILQGLRAALYSCKYFPIVFFHITESLYCQLPPCSSLQTRIQASRLQAQLMAAFRQVLPKLLLVKTVEDGS